MFFFVAPLVMLTMIIILREILQHCMYYYVCVFEEMSRVLVHMLPLIFQN